MPFASEHSLPRNSKNLHYGFVYLGQGVQIVRVLGFTLECFDFGILNLSFRIPSKGAYKLSGRGGVNFILGHEFENMSL